MTRRSADKRVNLARTLVGIALVIASAAFVRAQDDLPKPVGRVNDFARVLSDADARAIEDEINAVERETSAEIALVTIDSLGRRSVEEYANRLFNTWGIGKAERDNGVLVLVAVNDREMRIEVGYGLEPILPDGLAGAVIREAFLPSFRNDNMAAGIRAGMTRVLDIVRRNETLTPAQRAALDRAAEDAKKSWGVAIFLMLFVGLGAFISGSGAGAKVIAQMIGGLFFLGMALFFGLLGAPQAGLVMLVFFGIAVFVASFRLGRTAEWQKKLRGKSGRSKSGGWVVGGGGSSTSSGSSSSSSSSFGGGSSGGGGASGSW